MNFIDNFNVKLHISSEQIITLTSSNYLTSLELLKELDGDASAYDASPSSNMLMFGIDYDNMAPFHGLFSKGQKCELYNGLIRVGVFYITDYTLPSEDDLIATITAYDLFYNLINADIIPTFEILDGVDVKDYIKLVFKSVGISEEKIVVDTSIGGVLNYSICQGKTVAAILKEFCLATDTYIYVDADENICVIPKIQTISETVDVLDDNILYGLDLGSSYKNAYTGLKLNYNRLTVGEQEELLSFDTTLQPYILSELLNNELKSPLYIIDTIKVDGCLCSIDNIKATQNLLNLYITSAETEEKTATVKVLGKYINFVDSFVIRKEETTNENIMGVSSQLIQDTGTANNLIDMLYLRLNKKTMTAYIMPDDFNIELCKIFNVSSLSKGLNPIYAYVHGFRFSIVEGEVDLEIVLKEIEGVI